MTCNVIHNETPSTMSSWTTLKRSPPLQYCSDVPKVLLNPGKASFVSGYNSWSAFLGMYCACTVTTGLFMEYTLQGRYSSHQIRTMDRLWQDQGAPEAYTQMCLIENGYSILLKESKLQNNTSLLVSSSDVPYKNTHSGM